MNTIAQIVEEIAASRHHAFIVDGVSSLGVKPLHDALINHDKGAAHNVIVVAPVDNKDIGIDAIRELYIKTRSKRDAHKWVLIAQAELLSTAAQNALLKLLEEPPSKTTFIIATASKNSLLATVLSRAIHLAVPRLSSDASNKYAKSISNDLVRQNQALFLGEGKADELERLLSDEEYFSDQSTNILLAKQLLAASIFERIVLLKTVRDKTEMLNIISSCERILKHSLVRSPSEDLIKKITAVIDIGERLQANANLGLMKSKLVLALK